MALGSCSWWKSYDTFSHVILMTHYDLVTSSPLVFVYIQLNRFNPVYVSFLCLNSLWLLQKYFILLTFIVGNCLNSVYTKIFDVFLMPAFSDHISILSSLAHHVLQLDRPPRRQSKEEPHPRTIGAKEEGPAG